MQELIERIKKDGKVLPGHVLKVGSFLNHQIDVPFIMELGKEIAKRFENDRPNKILTVEASGIALAFAVAAVMRIPLVFAKKTKTSNIDSEAYSAIVHSYTHNKDNQVIVSKDLLTSDDRVLIIDDFLANGCALRGLINIVNQSGGVTVGCASAIEKGFQGGGDGLREEGIKVESLAIIDSMTDESLIFRM